MAAKALHEEDVRKNPRLANPRQAMDDEIADILMTQAQDGVTDWEEAERKLSRTTGTKRRAWVQRWKAAREEGKSIEASAKEANKELEGERRGTGNGGRQHGMVLGFDGPAAHNRGLSWSAAHSPRGW